MPIHGLTFVFVGKKQEVENKSVFTATKGQLYCAALTRTGVGNISVLVLESHYVDMILYYSFTKLHLNINYRKLIMTKYMKGWQVNEGPYNHMSCFIQPSVQSS